MTDLELWKEIVRATANIPASDIPKAVAKVRALLAESAPPARAEKKAPNRMALGGFNRGGGDEAA